MTKLLKFIALVSLLCLAISPLAPAAPPPGYYYVWGDEFNEPNLDTTKWDYWVLGKFDSEIDVTNAVSMNGSNLVITTYSVNGTNYSALIASDNHFRPRFGYYEASIQWGDTNGMCSAFWLRSPQMGSWVWDPFAAGGEIDICEHRYLGITTNYIATIVSDNIHWDGYGAYEQNAGSDNIGSNSLGQTFDITNGFQLYSLNWNKNGTYDFGIDGQSVWNGTPAPLFGRDAYIIFSAEVNNPPPAWDGSVPPGGYPPLAQSSLQLKIDYFHYYAPTNVLFWTGAASAAWTNSANWISNMVPAANCDLTFSYLSSNLNDMAAANGPLDGLIFLETASDPLIEGTNTIALGYGGIDMVSASRNVTLNAPILLASNQTWTVGIQNPGNLLTVNSSLSGSATLTKAGYGTLILDGTNSFSGVLNIDTGRATTNDGAICIADSASVANVASPISIRDTGMSASTLQLSKAIGNVSISQNISIAGRSTNVPAIENVSGNNTLAGNVTLTGGGPVYEMQSDTGTLSLGGTITAGNSISGSCTLTFQGAGDFSASGPIQNGSSATVGLAKTGTGTLTLSGSNPCSGATMVSGGTLAGNASIADSLMIASGGRIAPGTTNTIGVFSAGGSVTLASGSTTFMRLNKALEINDQLQAAGSLTYGGALIVTNLGGALASGDSFKLFNAGSYSGNFASLILPPLSGLGWNTNGLGNGVLTVGPTAPQVTTDLPSYLTLAVGQTYTYAIGVNATPPFGYEWFTGATAVPGQTNSTFTLAAQSPGTYTIDVVMTNIYGTATSSVSTLTVLAQPSTASATAIRNLNPAGYWPLQETSSPAPVMIETNFGSLGSLGNAYYPSTNSPYITLGAPGALAGDSDSAATFSSAGQTWAFVPRATSALTIAPPFTLEAWFMPQNSTYGVILGEGGGASLNGGPTYGGFQFGWAGGSQTRFELQLYHYGINAFSAIDTPSGYAVDNWYHYVATYDSASNAVIYVNGIPEASGRLAYIPDTWSPLTIGNGKWTGLTAARGASGTIDELAVYTNVLSPAEIVAHYAAGTNANPAISYKQTVLNDHPLLYYRMDNPVYVTPDTTTSPVALNYGSTTVEGAYLPGTVPGGVPGPAVSGLGPAPVGSPIIGIFSCVDTGYDPAFNPPTSHPFTALIWFKGNPADNRVQTLMGRGSNSWSLAVTGANGGLIWNSGAGSVTSSSSYNDGAWHEAAGVYDGSENYLYVDGALAASATATGAITGSTDNLYLGGDPDFTVVGVNERYFAGAIAHAAFFTNALTAQQIQTTYLAATAPAPPAFSTLSQGNNQLELNWTYGTLQTATNVNGPYLAVTNTTPPLTLPLTNSQQYFRLRSY
ncbi:MAG TPA: LamG-like jellyroll fold domain-containing protein [Verrucomicrobiae bacterium]|jgi:autotransporter-associated beta strand protein|nr:LamG-like jellyroll fold domain-containing protein [Verrucomicrobiae bacterium]